MPLPTTPVGGVFHLNNGHTLPKFGQGFSHNSGGFVDSSASVALEHGVRLFDTAKRYGNEKELGRFIEKNKKKLQKDACPLQICTKFWPGDIGVTPSLKEDVELAARKSASDLGVEKLDLYLLHWPGLRSTQYTCNVAGRQELWKAMENLVEINLVSSIGVSNFEPHHLRDILDVAKIKPCVNQIEFNPFQTQLELRKMLKEENIQLMGYCPLAKGEGLQHSAVKTIAQNHSCSPAAVLISWSLFHGAITIPATRSTTHVLSNIEATTMVVLTPEEIDTLDNLHCDLRVTWDPRSVP